MLRRAASGHIEATQLSKFAAASRIALAVIKGWPEAPSSPLHGGAGVPGAVGCACTIARGTRPGWAGGIEPVAAPCGFNGAPPTEICAEAPPASTSAPSATATVPILAIIDST